MHIAKTDNTIAKQLVVLVLSICGIVDNSLTHSLTHLLHTFVIGDAD